MENNLLSNTPQHTMSQPQHTSTQPQHPGNPSQHPGNPSQQLGNPSQHTDKSLRHTNTQPQHNGLLTKQNLGLYWLTTAQSIVLYLLIIMPAEYLLTEQFLVFYRIGVMPKTVLLLAIFTLVFTFNYFAGLQPSSRRFKFRAVLWFGALFLMLTANLFYTRYYRRLQRYPRVFRLSSDWTVQGKLLKIEGKNFGEPHEPGTVRLGDVEFDVKKWTRHEIVIQQPVPDSFFKGKLVVERANGHSSPPVRLEIVDPDLLYN